MDTDGDEVPETVQQGELGIRYSAEEVRRYQTPEVRVTVEGAEWSLDVSWIAHDRPALRGGTASTDLVWAISKDDGFALFVGGRLALHDSRERAMRAKPLRVGPPFEWRVTASQRGPHPLVNVALRDATGATLRVACRGHEEALPTVRVTGVGGDFEGPGEYG